MFIFLLDQIIIPQSFKNLNDLFLTSTKARFWCYCPIPQSLTLTNSKKRTFDVYWSFNNRFLHLSWWSSRRWWIHIVGMNFMGSYRVYERAMNRYTLVGIDDRQKSIPNWSFGLFSCEHSHMCWFALRKVNDRPRWNIEADLEKQHCGGKFDHYLLPFSQLRSGNPVLWRFIPAT
jgi:hypothetical protein